MTLSNSLSLNNLKFLSMQKLVCLRNCSLRKAARRYKQKIRLYNEMTANLVNLSIILFEKIYKKFYWMLWGFIRNKKKTGNSYLKILILKSKIKLKSHNHFFQRFSLQPISLLIGTGDANARQHRHMTVANNSPKIVLWNVVVWVRPSEHCQMISLQRPGQIP